MGGHQKRKKNRKAGTWERTQFPKSEPKPKKQNKDILHQSGFRDSYGRTLSADELIFPIIYHNEKTGVFHAIGTGYFVHPNGGFITATHVLFHKGIRLTPCYAVHTIGENRLLREIIAFFPHPTADIGIGMLRGKLRKGNEPHLITSFPISLTPPQIGDKIRTYAFPKSEVTVEDGVQVGTFQGTWSTGEIKKEIKPGEHHLLKTTAFETNMLIASRASGGPVLRGVHVIGVNSTGWEFGEGEPISFITPVTEILDMEISDSDGKKNTVRNLMETGHMPFTD